MEIKIYCLNIYNFIFAKRVTFQLLTIIDGKLISKDSVGKFVYKHGGFTPGICRPLILLIF